MLTKCDQKKNVKKKMPSLFIIIGLLMHIKFKTKKMIKSEVVLIFDIKP